MLIFSFQVPEHCVRPTYHIPNCTAFPCRVKFKGVVFLRENVTFGLLFLCDRVHDLLPGVCVYLCQCSFWYRGKFYYSPVSWLRFMCTIYDTTKTKEICIFIYKRSLAQGDNRLWSRTGNLLGILLDFLGFFFFFVWFLSCLFVFKKFVHFVYLPLSTRKSLQSISVLSNACRSSVALVCADLYLGVLNSWHWIKKISF